jgi:shikimate 5-dehydrogenase
MMNNDNSITVETRLFGYIAEEAHSSRFSSTVNKLFKENGVNAMVIPMNIRSDDVVFTLSQMRSSKLSGAVIASEYQEEAITLVDSVSENAKEQGLVDLIWIEEGRLNGELIMPEALERYAESNDFPDDIALRSHCRYFYDLIRGEENER